MQKNYCLYSSFSAWHSWSGQDVILLPHLMPSSLAMTSSIFCPFTSRQMPCRFPLHPPRNATFWITLSSSAVTSMRMEQVPWVVYWMCFMRKIFANIINFALTGGFYCSFPWWKEPKIKRNNKLGPHYFAGHRTAKRWGGEAF